MATNFDLEIELMDVKTTFLHGDLKENIYMTKVEHYVKNDHCVYYKHDGGHFFVITCK
jgi:hypothetical protein